MDPKIERANSVSSFNPSIIPSPDNAKVSNPIDNKTKELGESSLRSSLEISSPIAGKKISDKTKDSLVIDEDLILIQEDLKHVKKVPDVKRKTIEFASIYINLYLLQHPIKNEFSGTPLYHHLSSRGFLLFPSSLTTEESRKNYKDYILGLTMQCFHSHRGNFNKENRKTLMIQFGLALAALNAKEESNLLLEIPSYKSRKYIDKAKKALDKNPSLLKYLYIYPFSQVLTSEFKSTLTERKLDQIEKNEHLANEKFKELYEYVKEKYPDAEVVDWAEQNLSDQLGISVYKATKSALKT